MNDKELIKFAITIVGLMITIPIVFLLVIGIAATCCIDNILFELWLFFPVYSFIILMGWTINKLIREELI